MEARRPANPLPRYIRDGLTLRDMAATLLREASQHPSEPDADAKMRQGLRLLADALNHLEDSAYEEAVHRDLHVAGQAAHRLFPDSCHLTWTGDRYEHACPVALSHKRFGFSPGLRVGKKLCGLCGVDASECPHLPGFEYFVSGVKLNGHCVVCGGETCEHSPELDYWAEPWALVTEIVAMDHLSVVSRPRQPSARLTGIPVSIDTLRQVVGPEFVEGIEIHCFELHCQGFDRMPGDPRLEDPVALPPQVSVDEPLEFNS